MMNSITLLLLLGTISLSRALTKPGLKIRLSQRGLTFAAQNAIDAISTSMIGRPIGDIRGSGHVPVVGKIEYKFSHMSIVSFTKPNIQLKVAPGSGMTWTTTGGSIGVHGQWHIKKHRIGSDSGSFGLSVNGLGLSISLLIGMDKTGHPTINTTKCSSNIGSVHIHFHGGGSWLYHLFDHYIKKAIYSEIEKQLCSSITDVITKKLATLKLQFDIGKSMLLDFRLTDATNFSNNYLDSFHKGEIFDKNDPEEAPFLPHPLPNPSSAPRMVTLWVSDYVFSTFVFVVEQYGLLQYNITNEDLKKFGKDGFLNTTCPGELCIGSFIPELSRRFPHCSVVIAMRTAGEEKQPQFIVHSDDMNGFLSGTANFIVKSHNRTETPVFKVMLNMSLSVDPYIDKQRVKVKVTSSSLKIKILHSDIGRISQFMIETIFQVVTKFWVIPHINELGSKGFPLPTFEKVVFVNSTLKIEKGALQISTDFQKATTLHYRPNGG